MSDMKAICECGHEDDWHRRAPSTRVCQHKGCDCDGLKIDGTASVLLVEAEALWRDSEYTFFTDPKEAFIAGALAGMRSDDRF